MRGNTLLAVVAVTATACTDPSPAPADAGRDTAVTDARDDLAGDDTPAVDVPATIEPFDPSPRGGFPPGFLWGSATAPYQIEGGLPHTDWAAWEAMPGRILHGDRADDGPRSATHYEADLDALVETHQNAYRLGFDWSRVFPTRAQWQRCFDARAQPLADFHRVCLAAASPEGVAYYHAVLDAMARRRLTPMVTLYHFVLPDYLNDLTQPVDTQGFVREGITEDFFAWSRFAGVEYGAQVDWWITLNEPLVIAAGGYLMQAFPPGAAANFDRLRTIVRNMIFAHARGYDALHEADTVAAIAGDGGATVPARVSIASHNRVFRALRPGNEADEAAAESTRYVNNDLFLNAIVRGDLDVDADGALDGPMDVRNDPRLRARVDYVGLNYYGLSLVQGVPALPILHGIPAQTGLATPLPKSDLDWDIYPQGFLLVLREVQRYGLPIVVTENGVADDAGTNRPRYLAEHLAVLARAIREGVPVQGYFHWSVIDNFEWAEGFCPRFGLYRVDYTDPNRRRVATPGAMTYRRIIDDNAVSDALLQSLPAYAPPRLCHPPVDAGR